MPLNTLKALKERRAALRKEMQETHAKLSAEPRSDEHQQTWADQEQRAKDLEDEILRTERIDALEAQAPDTRTGLPGGTMQPGDQLDSRQDDPVVNPDPGKYNFLRACDRFLETGKVDGYEGEISQEIAKRTGNQAKGFYVPWNLRLASSHVERRATFNAGTTADDLVETTNLPTLIDALRNAVVVRQAGATVISDLVGNVDIPKISGTPSFSWGAEDVAASETNPTTGQVQLRPETVSAYTEVTRRLLKQTSGNAQAVAFDQLIRSHALAIDSTALNGAGSGNQPEGVGQNSSTNLVSIGTDGGAPTWAHIVEMETKVNEDNAQADPKRMTYIVNAVTKGKLKTTEKASSTAQFIMGDGMDAVMNGYRSLMTNTLPSNLTKGSGTDLSMLLFGAWEALVLAFWGGLDVLIDPYSAGTKGNVRIIMHQDADVKFRHDESFCRIVDAVTT